MSKIKKCKDRRKVKKAFSEMKFKRTIKNHQKNTVTPHVSNGYDLHDYRHTLGTAWTCS